MEKSQTKVNTAAGDAAASAVADAEQTFGQSEVPAAVALSWDNLSSLPPTVVAPGYDPRQLEVFCLHIGGGSAFFKSLMGSYMQQRSRTNPRSGIHATSTQSRTSIDALAKQDGLYLLCVEENGKHTVEVMAPIVETSFAQEDPQAFARRMADEKIELVTLTVSNAGYCLANGDLDEAHADVVNDLATPDKPKSIYGFLALGLAHRRKTGRPLAVMSLDNVEMNSRLLKRALLRFIELSGDSELKAWVEANVHFPVTLVDRITPKATDELCAQIKAETGVDASVIVTTEAFVQLVVERWPGMPEDFEQVGIQVVDDCAPYWRDKFIGVNTSHCVVSFCGHRLGIKYIHDAMARDSVARLLTRAHAEWFDMFSGEPKHVDGYLTKIRRRFADRALNDTVQRVAARGTSKVSERLLFSLEQVQAASGKLITVPTFMTAVWLLNLGRVDEHGEHIALHDTEAERLQYVHQEVVTWLRSLKSDDVQTDNGRENVRLFLLHVAEELGDARFARLSCNDQFVDDLAWSLVEIHQHGLEQAIEHLLSR